MASHVYDTGNSITWHFDILPTKTRKALMYLRDQAWLDKTPWYLAGGTALALRFGHRQSVDLDFFAPQKGVPASSVAPFFSSDVWIGTMIREDTVFGELMGAKVSFIEYPFFAPREPFAHIGHVRVLDPRDIAVMKIIAISQRGRKRDFVDLYWYALKQEPLLDVLRRVSDQYPGTRHDFHHIVRSLTYFADAEDDPMPKLFTEASWGDIKAYFEKEVPRITRELLDLK